MLMCQGAIERGVFAQAIRPPTVPALTSRLRLTVMASHTPAELRMAARVFAEVARGLGLAVVDPFTFRTASGLYLVARPTRPAIELYFGLFFPANRPRSALVRAFVQATRSVVTSAASGSAR